MAQADFSHWIFDNVNVFGQSPAIQEWKERCKKGRCYQITIATRDVMKGEIVWQDIVPEKPSGALLVLDSDWKRMYTILKQYAAGNNDYQERWISIPSLLQLYQHIFSVKVNLSDWQVVDPVALAKRFLPLCHTWEDCLGNVYVRLVRKNPPQQLIVGTFWKFESVTDESDWAVAIRDLQDNFNAVYSTPEVMDFKFSELQNFMPAVTTEMLKMLRGRFYAMLVAHFPLGLDRKDLALAYRTMWGEDYTDMCNRCLTEDLIIGEVLSDIVCLAKESDLHSVVYPKLRRNVEIPSPIVTKCCIELKNDKFRIGGLRAITK